MWNAARICVYWEKNSAVEICRISDAASTRRRIGVASSHHTTSNVAGIDGRRQLPWRAHERQQAHGDDQRHGEADQQVLRRLVQPPAVLHSAISKAEKSSGLHGELRAEKLQELHGIDEAVARRGVVGVCR